MIPCASDPDAVIATARSAMWERAMRERESVPTSEARFPRWSTPVLAIVGGSLFVSGVFVLAAAGHAYSVATHLFILGSAIVLAFPLLLVTLLVAGSEALLGRAWANGLRRLSPPDRRLRATSARALRYASILWLANGGAMWLATVVAQF